MVAIVSDKREFIFKAVADMYTDVATHPEKTFHFPTGRLACLFVGYPGHQLDLIPAAAPESFAGVGYPFAAGMIREGDVILEVGSGSGTDALIAGTLTGPRGRVYGLDMTQAMLDKLRRNIAAMGAQNVVPLEGNALSIAPGNWFNLNSGDGNYFYLKNVDFPKNFIIEFDIAPKKTGGRIAAGLLLYGEDEFKEMDNNPQPGNGGIMISIEKENWNTWGYKKGEKDKITGLSKVNPVVAEKVNHVIIWVQNRRVRIYHKQAKVLDMPTNIYEGTNFNRFCFRLSRGASCGSYISNFRITDASPDMRSKLLTDAFCSGR